MKYKFAQIIVLLIFMVLFSHVAFGDSPPPPWSKTYTSQNGSYTLVTFSPYRENLKEYEESTRKGWESLHPAIEEAKQWEKHLRDEIDVEKSIRHKYPTSGLYLTSNPNTPLLKVDWYELWGQAFVTNSGIIIRFNPKVDAVIGENQMRFPNTEQKVLFFYTSGVETRSYKLSELAVKNNELRETAGGYYWANEWNGQASLNNEKNVFTLTKTTGEKVAFDMTGEIVSGNLPSQQNSNSRSEVNNVQPQKSENSKSFCGGIALLAGLLLSLLLGR